MVHGASTCLDVRLFHRACAPSFPLPDDFWITEWQEAAEAGAAVRSRGGKATAVAVRNSEGSFGGRPSARAVVGAVPEATVRKIHSTVRLVGTAKT
ncbi:hypothetical protein ACIA8E_12250 [Streptomyces sp. NPDC051664]|uniref:hypothetical protein n=1 Tax=Streptomyces sp. NPDC051664 TaxID=3365668 RepID=UPI00379B80A0